MRLGGRLLSGVIGVVLVGALANHHAVGAKRPAGHRDTSRLSARDEGAVELGPVGSTG